MILSTEDIKKYALNIVVLNTIQICSIMAASQMQKTENSNLTEFINRILKTPEDASWCKVISYYVVINNQEIEWTKLEQNRKKIETQLVEKCKKAILIIGS